MIASFVNYSLLDEALGSGEKKKKKKNREEKRVGVALNSRLLRALDTVIFLIRGPR